MLQSNLEEIKSKFAELLTSIQDALEDNNINVERAHRVIVEVCNCGRDCLPTTSLRELFDAASDHKFWDYTHHSPVEKLVRRFIPDHMGLISEYKQCLSGFCCTTRLLDFILYANFNDSHTTAVNELPLMSYTNREYDTLTAKLETGRSLSLLSLEYVQDLWNSFAEEFKIPSLTAVIEKILKGCLEITWQISHFEAEIISTSAYKSIAFFHRHRIIYISISGQVIYDVQHMVSLKDSHHTISSVMQKCVQDKLLSAEGYNGGNSEYDEGDRSSSRKMLMDENTPMHDATSSTSVDPSHSIGNSCMQYTHVAHKQHEVRCGCVHV